MDPRGGLGPGAPQLTPSIYRCHIARIYTLNVSIHLDIGTFRLNIPTDYRLHIEELPDYQTSLLQPPPVFYDMEHGTAANCGGRPTSGLQEGISGERESTYTSSPPTLIRDTPHLLDASATSEALPTQATTLPNQHLRPLLSY